MTRFAMLSVAVLVASVLVRAPAAAQSAEEVAAARQLFEAGVEAGRQGDWVEARGRFERSYAIAPRASTLVNLAAAQAQTGQLVAATESYQRYLAEATSGRDARFRRRAQTALAELEGRIAQITFTIEGLEPDDQIALGERELSHAMIGVAIPVDPGASTLVVMRGEDEVLSVAVDVAEGEARSFELEVTAPQTPTPIQAATAAVGEDGSSSVEGPAASDDTGLIVGIVLAVVGAIAVGVTIGVVVAVEESNSPFQGNLGVGVLEFD